MTSKTDLTKLGEVVSADVLIIGGGTAGLMAAIKAKEARPTLNVLVVDKATPGSAGQAPVAGGGNGLMTEENRLEGWFKWKVETGGYLNDQEFTYAYGKDNYKVCREVASWGAPFERDEKGEPIVRFRDTHRDVMRWASSPAMQQFIRKKARSEGTKILPRVMIVDLLTEGERVVGAVGFSIENGQFYILTARATILANGGCMYQYRSHFKQTSGEGVAMAYNVGAEMRNAEFGNTVGFMAKVGLWGARGLRTWLQDANGKDLLEKHGVPEAERGRTDYQVIIPLMSKEIAAGGGVYSPYEPNEFFDRMGIKPGERVEIVPGPSVRQGPVRVDLHCRTTLPSLWAVGDSSFGGSSIGGAQSPCAIGGEGLPIAWVTGYWAGLDVADCVSEAADPKIDSSQVSRLKEQAYAPLKREAGFGPREAIQQVQETIIPLKYNWFRSGERMQEALAKIEEIKGRLPTLWAKDPHYLMKCHEAASMTLCAEMTYRPALMRQESRSSHMREDYPERDDKNWLKWIIIKKEKEEMKLWTEPVPIDKYKIKPPKKA
ncbi:FAD-binding protein [Chloroflexota bacterium]